jgi:hypothetical protein
MTIRGSSAPAQRNFDSNQEGNNMVFHDPFEAVLALQRALESRLAS